MEEYKTTKRSAKRVVFKKGEILFRQNDESNDLYVIKSGKVEVYIEKNGKEVILGTLEKGNCLGEMALLDNRSRSASARVIDEVTALVIRKDTFIKRTEHIPEWLLTIIRMIISRLRDADKKIRDSDEKIEIMQTVTIISYILGKWSSAKEPIDLKVIKVELLSLCGMDNTQLNSLIATLKGKGLIKIDKGILCGIDDKELKLYIDYLKGAFDANKLYDVEIGDDALEFLETLSWLAKRMGHQTEAGYQLTIDFRHSKTENMIREFVDNKTLDELVGKGLLVADSDLKSKGNVIYITFDKTKLEKFINFKKMLKLFDLI